MLSLPPIFGRKKAQKTTPVFLRLLRFFAAGFSVALAPAVAAAEPVAKVIKEFCLDCHDADKKKGDLVLEGLDPAKAAADPKLWENVVHKLSHRQMPPMGEARPKDAEYDAAIAQLTAQLDRAA